MKITNVKEPEYSLNKLKEYEKKYNISSDLFYLAYKKHNLLLEDEYEASDWVFNYEIYKRSKRSD